MRIVIYDNGLSENRVIIKKIGLFITLFAILRVLILKGDGTVKGQQIKLEMQSCHNDVRAMTPCFYVSNEGATLGLSRAICTKSSSFCDIGDR